MSYRVFEGASCFYLTLSPEGGHPDEIIALRRTLRPPESLSSILEFQPPVSLTDIERECRLVAEACLIVGFVRFLSHFSIELCTRREAVGSIASRPVFSIAATQTVLISPPVESPSGYLLDMLFSVNRRLTQTSLDSAEKKYASLFQTVDLTKDFYFSHDYNLTRTLQTNVLSSFAASDEASFVWNEYLQREFAALIPAGSRSRWVVPIVHGFYQQRRFSSFGKTLDVILIARRSRHFAGEILRPLKIYFGVN